MNYKNLLILFIVSICIGGCQQSDPPLQAYELVWSDEFDSDTLDESKWEFLIGDGTGFGIPGWGNNERQYYKKENVTLDSGYMTITARREFTNPGEPTQKNYTSSRIRTENLGDWNQGKFEARIKMDKQVGLWYAFWMLPSNPVDPWPLSGEIDIMEYVGNRPKDVLFNVHYQNILGNHEYTGFTLIQPDTFDFTDFHTYAVEWDDFGIKWSVDNEQIFEVKKSDDNLNGVWPFDKSFHIILNVAVGGNLTGDVVDDFNFPAEMVVDYVRVYQYK